jgi:nucleotide-binding universal stress UspA family protein
MYRLIRGMKEDTSVLAAVDFSPGSRRALSEAVRICKTFDRRLHVIHVIEGRVVEGLADMLQRPLAQIRREALAKARRTLEKLVGEEDAPPDTRLHLAIGAPVPEILSCVEELEPALLVLGERGLPRASLPAESLAASGLDRAATRVLLVNAT